MRLVPVFILETNNQAQVRLDADNASSSIKTANAKMKILISGVGSFNTDWLFGLLILAGFDSFTINNYPKRHVVDFLKSVRFMRLLRRSSVYSFGAY